MKFTQIILFIFLAFTPSSLYAQIEPEKGQMVMGLGLEEPQEGNVEKRKVEKRKVCADLAETLEARCVEDYFERQDEILPYIVDDFEEDHPGINGFGLIGVDIPGMIFVGLVYEECDRQGIKFLLECLINDTEL